MRYNSCNDEEFLDQISYLSKHDIFYDKIVDILIKAVKLNRIQYSLLNVLEKTS